MTDLFLASLAHATRPILPQRTHHDTENGIGYIYAETPDNRAPLAVLMYDTDEAQHTHDCLITRYDCPTAEIANNCWQRLTGLQA